jgi:hypothetical protein
VALTAAPPKPVGSRSTSNAHSAAAGAAAEFKQLSRRWLHKSLSDRALLNPAIGQLCPQAACKTSFSASPTSPRSGELASRKYPKTVRSDSLSLRVSAAPHITSRRQSQGFLPVPCQWARMRSKSSRLQTTGAFTCRRCSGRIALPHCVLAALRRLQAQTLLTTLEQHVEETYTNGLTGELQSATSTSNQSSRPGVSAEDVLKAVQVRLGRRVSLPAVATHATMHRCADRR